MPASRCSTVGWSCRSVSTVFPSACSSRVMRHPEARRVVVDVGPVIHHQPLDGNDLEVVEAIREHGAVSGDHVEARSTSRAHVHLADGAGEPIGTEPLAEGIRIGPRGEHRVACGVENSNEDDLTIERPRRRIGDGRGTAHGFSDVGGDAVRSDVRRRCASRRSRRCSHAARVCSAHAAISTSGSGRSRHGRRCPSRPRLIRPACSRTFR